MLSFYKKYYKTAFDIALIVVTILLFMFLFSYLYKIAAPIFLSFLVFVMIEPLAKFLNKRGMKKSIATAISVLLFVLILLGVIVGAGAIFIGQAADLARLLGNNSETLQIEFNKQLNHIKDRITMLPEGTVEQAIDKAKQYSGTIIAYGAKLAQWFLSWLIGFLSSFSTFMINFSIGIILAYFLSIEIADWKKVAREKTPNTFKIAFQFLRENVLRGIATYLKSQLKLIGITFIIIYIALLVLQVNNSFSIAVLAAIFDFLPLLGVSTVFVPWIIYLFIVGNTSLALWLTGLLAVVILVRQFLEPKITGESLGVSAFTMLSFMIISLSLFGIAGLILSPVLIILIKALYDQGYLQKWIRKPEDY